MFFFEGGIRVGIQDGRNSLVESQSSSSALSNTLLKSFYTD